MLNQTEEKHKKTNFVEQLQENKIFKKVATTCQRHYKKRPTQDKNKDSEVKIPVVVPRSRKPPSEDKKSVKPLEKTPSSETLRVADSASVSLSIPSINSAGKTLKHPGGSFRLNGSSTKSDTDSGFSGDTQVGDLRIKQVRDPSKGG